ncbi:hypothetical protein DPMN_178247 [Dreissena polymorpha]|uniref:Uncharacterized protein n=1 Tax=Dreissena polymorpha TaxID=45954 RepID=A0A9D4EA88_DREPO|nr:hypothetical protein DPMN_178247 [Dreissena polymorpha]
MQQVDLCVALLNLYSTANAEQTYFAIRSGKAKRVNAAAARRNEAMPRQPLKPRQYAAERRISPRSLASVRRGKLRSET